MRRYDNRMWPCLDCGMLIDSRNDRCIACQNSRAQSAWQRHMCDLIHRQGGKHDVSVSELRN